MEYKGKLYGKIGNKYFDTGHTTDDYDGLIARVEELDKIVGQKLPIHNVVERSEQLCEHEWTQWKAEGEILNGCTKCGLIE